MIHIVFLARILRVRLILLPSHAMKSVNVQKMLMNRMVWRLVRVSVLGQHSSLLLIYRMLLQ